MENIASVEDIVLIDDSISRKLSRIQKISRKRDLKGRFIKKSKIQLFRKRKWKIGNKFELLKYFISIEKIYRTRVIENSSIAKNNKSDIIASVIYSIDKKNS